MDYFLHIGKWENINIFIHRVKSTNYEYPAEMLHRLLASFGCKQYCIIEYDPRFDITMHHIHCTGDFRKPPPVHRCRFSDDKKYALLKYDGTSITPELISADYAREIRNNLKSITE